MKKKGFTLVELLVVIAIIAMLLAILMPALGKVRQLAQRIMCGTNLGGIGKAMLTYATDDKYESFPIAGGGGAYWDVGTLTKQGKCSWAWDNKFAIPPGVTTACTPGTCTTTLSACLYLLVKYAGMSPDQFICPGASEKEFELSIYTLKAYNATYARTITDVWDFGARTGSAVGEAQLNPGKLRGRGHNSYSFQIPLPVSVDLPKDKYYPISTSANPSLPVLADRSPYWDAAETDAMWPTWDATNGRLTNETVTNSNSLNHQKEGQNVAYADQHVKFEKQADCGVEGDNIYLTWNKSVLETTDEDEGRRHGDVGVSGVSQPPLSNVKPPQNSADSWLANDFN